MGKLYLCAALGVMLIGLAGSANPLLAAKRKNPVISRITIHSTDIFDLETKPYLDKIPYNWINILHIKTRREIIKQEILFEVGDRVDDFLIQETERNLRNLSFIRAARISKFPQRDGTMVLVLYVNDSWTTEPQLNLQGINQIDDVEIGFKEKNLFGYGKSLEFLYTDDSDSNNDQRTYRLKDPRVFGSRWKFVGQVKNDSKGEQKGLSLNRPFFAVDSKWSAGAEFTKNETIIEEFANNSKVSEFDQEKEITQLRTGVKIGTSRQPLTRGSLRYKRETQHFSRNDQTTPGRGIPQREKFETLFFDLDILKNKFVEMTRLERMTRIEDINLGPALRVSPGFSPTFLSADQDTADLEVAYEQNYLIQKEHLLRTNVNYSTRRAFEDPVNEIYEIDLKFYQRESTRQTLVIHSRLTWGEELDSDNQIFLGGNNGLRAFQEDGIVGSKSFLLNIEDRIFLTDEVFNLFALGTVIYLDTGYVWARNRPLAASDLKTDIGVGLRMGLTRSSNEVIVRVDISHRLNRINSNDREWVISFGSGQAF